jgi:knotted carbamoyltransferase YgeW
MKEFEHYISNIKNTEASLFKKDILLTWERSVEELKAVLNIADALKYFHSNNISTRLFESGIAVSLFRDNSTRTRFSFASASNLLGLSVQDLDEGKSQIAHGETVRETANMISFLSEVIGIRDDMYLGAGSAFMSEVGEALDLGTKEGVLNQRPALVNLQCDMDHPTQTMADFLHLTHHFASSDGNSSIDNLRGKKIAMTWAYSPSYGKPLSVPQGVIALMTRFGMEVSLAFPESIHSLLEMPEKLPYRALSSEQSLPEVQTAAYRNLVNMPRSWLFFCLVNYLCRKCHRRKKNDVSNEESQPLSELDDPYHTADLPEQGVDSKPLPLCRGQGPHQPHS